MPKTNPVYTMLGAWTVVIYGAEAGAWRPAQVPADLAVNIFCHF